MITVYDARIVDMTMVMFRNVGDRSAIRETLARLGLFVRPQLVEIAVYGAAAPAEGAFAPQIAILR